MIKMAVGEVLWVRRVRYALSTCLVYHKIGGKAPVSTAISFNPLAGAASDNSEGSAACHAIGRGLSRISGRSSSFFAFWADSRIFYKADNERLGRIFVGLDPAKARHGYS